MRSARVCLLGHLCSISGHERLELEVSESETIRSLLIRLTEMFREEFKMAILDSSGQIRPNIIVRHNGENVVAKRGLATNIRDRDQVVVMTAVSGG